MKTKCLYINIYSFNRSFIYKNFGTTKGGSKNITTTPKKKSKPNPKPVSDAENPDETPIERKAKRENQRKKLANPSKIQETKTKIVGNVSVAITKARVKKLSLSKQVPTHKYLKNIGSGKMKVKFPNKKVWRETRLDQVANGKPLNFTPGSSNKSHSKMQGKLQRVVQIDRKSVV